MIYPRNFFYRTLFLLLAVSSLALQAAQAEDNYNIPSRVFAVTVPGLTTEPGRINIPIPPGVGKASPIAKSGVWRIYGGTILEQPLSSKPFTVELWGTAGSSYKLIVRVVVKYFATTNNGSQGWQPMYQLSQEPVMIRTPSGWKPLMDSTESPEIFDVTNRQEHSLEGYRRYLDIKAYQRAVSIDSWKVKPYR